MNNDYKINWSNYLYKGNAITFGEQLANIGKTYRKSSMERVPSRQEVLPKNRFGIPRITYYAGFTPWTNTPIANKNGGII